MSSVRRCYTPGRGGVLVGKGIVNRTVYLRLEEACQKYNLERDHLTRAVERGLVRAIRVNGHIAVAEEDVRKLRATNGELIAELPRYIPLDEALRRFAVSEDALKEAISSGKIRTAYIGEEATVAEQDVRELAKGQEVVVVRREDFEHLRGNRLGISEAARKYGLQQRTVSNWVRRGIIRKVGQQGQKVLIDEADIAYAAKVYKLKRGGQGKRIFDASGKPYIPKTKRSGEAVVVVAE